MVLPHNFRKVQWVSKKKAEIAENILFEELVKRSDLWPYSGVEPAKPLRFKVLNAGSQTKSL